MVAVRRDSVQSTPDQFTAQGSHIMPSKKRIVGRIEVRVDRRTAAALEKLIEIHGDHLSQSDIIRDAIIEKAERDAKQHEPPKLGT
jgi:hypothetical protein